MFKRVAIPLAAVAVIAAAALGGSTGPKIQTSVSSTMASEPAGPASGYTDATPPSAQVADTTTKGADSAASVDTRRAGQIMRFYKGIGAIERWSIKAVEVSDGQVTVKTELFPKSSNRPLFVGACTALIGAESWIESVRIEGLDATGHASWYSGEDACQTQGL